MKLEVGKKYERNGEVVEVKFIDNAGTAWGINLGRRARSISRPYFDQWTEYTEPKPPQYVPYTWEDREELRGRWFIDALGRECMAIRFTQNNGGFWVNNHSGPKFIKECKWLDGTPCGKVVTE